MELVKLNSVAEVFTGYPFKSNSYGITGIRTLRGENITEGRLRWDSIKCWDQPFDKKNHYSLRENDIVIGMDGSKVGKNKARIFKSDLPLLLAQRVACVRANQLNDQVFLFYCIHNPRFEDYVYRIQTGSSVPHISKTQIEDFVIPRIEISEQKSIAKVLSDIDAKIVLNNKINAELESMAKLIYDFWFVQFDFPDENGKPYKSAGGKMVYNEKLNREIPQDWSNGELQDIANITMGQSPSGDSYNEDRNGEVFYQGCTDFGLRFPTNRKFTTQPTRFAKTGDILLSVRAPVGTMNIANEDCCIGRGLAALNSKNGSITHLDGVLQHMKQIFDLRNSSGTTFGSITKGDLFSIPVVIPDKKTLQRFDEVTNPMFEKQNLIGSENQMLEELRDWLLPMLMNGQVTIKD